MLLNVPNLLSWDKTVDQFLIHSCIAVAPKLGFMVQWEIVNGIRGAERGCCHFQLVDADEWTLAQGHKLQKYGKIRLQKSVDACLP